MTAATPDAQFEIRVDGVVRTHREVRETAIEAARFVQGVTPRARRSPADGAAASSCVAADQIDHVGDGASF